MLKYNKFVSKYKSLLKILSFNRIFVNSLIWNYRSILRYVLFYILKKTIFARLWLFYKLYTSLRFYDWKRISIRPFSFYLHSLESRYLQFIQSFYSKRVFDVFHPILHKKVIKDENFRNNLLLLHNHFLLLYKNYTYMIYLWLYSLKLSIFYVAQCTSLPSRKRLFVVLRSPHKDKRSREKYQLTKILKNIRIPSFLYDRLLGFSFSNSNFALKCQVSIRK